MPQSLPLQGLRVVDLSRVLSGPFCTMMLADLGADVIKIERPIVGDDNRRVITYSGRSPSDEDYFYPMNRSKLSVALDLQSAVDREKLYDLVADADVVVENFAPGVTGRLGIDFAACRNANSQIVYVSISGFGSTGPYRDRKAYDGVVQAMSGTMIASSMARDRGIPVRPGMMLADVFAGMYAAVGVLAGLLKVGATGVATHLDFSMLEALASLWSVNDFDADTEPRWAEWGQSSDGVRLICREEDLLRLRDVPTGSFESTEAITWASHQQISVIPLQNIEDYLRGGTISNRSMLWSLPHPRSGNVSVVGSAFADSRGTEASFAPPLLGEHQSILDRPDGPWPQSDRFGLRRQAALQGEGVLGDLSVLDLTGQVTGRLAYVLLSDLGARTASSARDRSPTGEDTPTLVLTDSRTPVPHGAEQVADLSYHVHFRPLPEDSLPADTQSRLSEGAVQIVTGLASVTGVDDGDWTPVDLPIASLAAALHAVSHVLIWRLTSPERLTKARADVVMSDALTSMWSTTAARWLATGELPGPVGNSNPNRCPARAYRTQDAWMQLIAAGDTHWKLLCEELQLEGLSGRPDLMTNEARVARRDEIDSVLEPIFASGSTGYWVERLASLGIPVAPVNGLAELLADPQMRHRLGTRIPLHPADLRSPLARTAVGSVHAMASQDSQ